MLLATHNACRHPIWQLSKRDLDLTEPFGVGIGAGKYLLVTNLALFQSVPRCDSGMGKGR